MSLVKRKISNQKPARAAYNRQMENLSVKGQSDDPAIRWRLCNFMIGLFTLCVVLAGVLIVLHGIGVLMLPTTVLTALVVVVFGAAQRMLSKIVKSSFH